MKSIMVDDFVMSSHYSLTCEKWLMEKIHATWNTPDKIIVDMSHTKLFDGKRCWDDLSVTHFKFLLCGSFSPLDKLSTENRMNTSIPAVDSFLFLASSLIYKLEKTSECSVETLRIRRIRSDYLHFDFIAASSLELKNVVQKPGLKIIVDNTKE